jgi:hypothetical protein
VKGEPVDPDAYYFANTDAFTAGVSCSVGTASGGVSRRVEGDNPAPPVGLGASSWGFTPKDGATGSFYGVGMDVPTSAGLETFELQVYGAAAGSGRAMVFAWPPVTTDGNVWVGTATVDGRGNAWTTVDAAGLTYTWTEYDERTYQRTGESAGSKTVTDFETDKGRSTVGMGYRGYLSLGCDGQPFLYDGFKYGAAGSVTTLDFESLSTRLSIGATKPLITAGQSSSITGSTSARDVLNPPVDLEVRKYGSSDWTTVATVEAPETVAWTMKKLVAPLQQASYRWHYRGSEANEPAYSPTFTIKVKTALTATVVDRTLRRGQNPVVTGRTRPAKPGTTVTLMRKTASGSVVLARTRVKSDGSYKVAYLVNRAGTWTVYTTIPTASGNLAGRSVNLSASVS